MYYYTCQEVSPFVYYSHPLVEIQYDKLHDNYKMVATSFIPENSCLLLEKGFCGNIDECVTYMLRKECISYTDQCYPRTSEFLSTYHKYFLKESEEDKQTTNCINVEDKNKLISWCKQKCSSNAWEWNRAKDKKNGLFYACSKINHNCNPNCHIVEGDQFQFNDLESCILLFNKRPLEKYEEITISYWYETGHVQNLKSVFNWNCQCGISEQERKYIFNEVYKTVKYNLEEFMEVYTSTIYFYGFQNESDVNRFKYSYLQSCIDYNNSLVKFNKEYSFMSTKKRKLNQNENDNFDQQLSECESQLKKIRLNSDENSDENIHICMLKKSVHDLYIESIKSCETFFEYQEKNKKENINKNKKITDYYTSIYNVQTKNKKKKLEVESSSIYNELEYNMTSESYLLSKAIDEEDDQLVLQYLDNNIPIPNSHKKKCVQFLIQCFRFNLEDCYIKSCLDYAIRLNDKELLFIINELDCKNLLDRLIQQEKQMELYGY